MMAAPAVQAAPLRQALAPPQFTAVRATLADARGLIRQLTTNPVVRAEPPARPASRTPPARRERPVERPVTAID